MGNEAFHKYTTRKLELFISKYCKEESRTGQGAASVYKELFDGLDISLLQMMCIQVKHSLERHEKNKFLSVMSDYADKVAELVPAWGKLCSSIAGSSCQLAKDMSQACNAYKNQDKDTASQLADGIKDSLQDFKENFSEEISSVTKMQENLSNFITGELSPAISENKDDSGLDKCFSNEIFINGTEASVYNGSILFSFISSTVLQSIDILGKADSSWTLDGKIFSISGQSQIWEIIQGVLQELNDRLSGFDYIPPSYFDKKED